MAAKLTVSILLMVAAVAFGASILDLFDFDATKKLIELPQLRNDQPNRNCLCKGPACVCCVDFNITLVDLGGPGCVHMKYLSPEDGFSVKVSYGKNLIHSGKLQGANPPPVCLEVFGKFAQVCAKFNDLAPTSDGLRGCIELEPKLLGESQLEFPVGCFKSSSGGMEMEDPPAEPEEPAEEEEETTTEENNSFDPETFLLGVYHTAEQGVALLSSLLELPKLNGTKPIKAETTTALPETSSATASQRRGPKALYHPNQL